MTVPQVPNRTLQGGAVTEVGGELRIAGIVTPAGGTQAAAIASVATAGSATAALNATAVNAILVALRDVGIIDT